MVNGRRLNFVFKRGVFPPENWLSFKGVCMSLTYGWEKLNMSVHYLSGSASQSERLFNAVTYSLVKIKPEYELPESLREDFATLMAELSAVKGTDDEGNIRATINSFGEVELSSSIEKVINFYDLVCRHPSRTKLNHEDGDGK